MRYTLGPTFGPITVTTMIPPSPIVPPGGPALVDQAVTLGAVSDTSAELSFPPFDPSVTMPVVEARIYLAPAGSALPSTANEYVASPFPVQVVGVLADPIGQTFAIPLPIQGIPSGDYLLQVVLGFPS